MTIFFLKTKMFETINAIFEAIYYTTMCKLLSF